MKKILFIIGSLRGGGAEKALVELLAHFDYTRFDVTLCVVFYGGVYMEQIPASVKVIYLFEEKSGYWRESLQRKAFRYYTKYNSTWLMRQIILYKTKWRKFDTIVSYLEGIPLVLNNLIRGQAKKNISWIHCDLYNYHWTNDVFFLPGYEATCYANMDELVFVSKNSLESFNKLYNISIPKHCIYNIIDVGKINEIAAKKEIPHQNFTIIAVGTLNKVKSFDRLIRLARRFKDDGYNLTFQILGTGPDMDKLLELCNTLGVSDCVTFLGFKSPSYSYIAAADVLVSTSLSEGLPFVICEALALGIPVVATKTAGSIELLDNGRYGMLTEQNDESIYENLKEVIDNQSLRDELKLKSKERALGFDVRQTMERIYELIE